MARSHSDNSIEQAEGSFARIVSAGDVLSRKRSLTIDAPQSGVLQLGRMPSALIGVVFGLILTSLPLTSFKDRHNYLQYADISFDLLTKNFAISPVVAIANEPIWLLINSALALVLTPEWVLRLVIFFPATMVAYLLLRLDPRNWPWLLLFLFLPQILKNHITHLRQGVGVAAFLLGWFSTRKSMRLLLMGLAPLIHASFFFVLGLHVLTHMLLKCRLASDIRTLAYFAFSVGTGMGLGVVALWVGARQATVYGFSGGDISGIAFAFWSFMLCVFLSQGKVVVRDHALAVAGIVFYLGTYYFLEVTARIFESLLVLVLLAGLQLTDWRRFMFLTGIVAWGGLQWAVILTQEGSPF